jgi:hypothetical protein
MCGAMDERRSARCAQAKHIAEADAVEADIDSHPVRGTGWGEGAGSGRGDDSIHASLARAVGAAVLTAGYRARARRRRGGASRGRRATGGADASRRCAGTRRGWVAFRGALSGIYM